MATNSQKPEDVFQGADWHQLLIESVQDYALIAFDAGGCIVEWNVGAQRLFGFTADQVVGQHSEILFTPEDRAAEAPRIELDNARIHGSTADERWHMHADGSRRYVSGRLQSVWVGSRLLGYMKVGRDETQRKMTADDLERAKHAAEEANAAKDRFLAILSHELRNPLSPILTGTALLLQDQRLPEDLRGELLSIERNAYLEARLIDDLLDTTRIAQGKVHLKFQPVQMHTMIAHVLDICQPDIQAKAMNVDMKLAAAHPHVHGDPARLQQILWNLLKNAIKFSPRGRAIRIQTENPAPAEFVFSVSDEGVGIDLADLDRIFRPFEQVQMPMSGRYGGLGLGLAIARTLSELHQGTLTAASNGVGSGATFTLKLPVIHAEALGETPVRGSGPHDVTAALRVLVVDDNHDAAESLGRLLKAWGHSVQIADSGPSAMALAEAHPFDLVVGDIDLGGYSGLDLIRDLHAKFPSIRGLALSGYGTEADARHSLDAGYERHLSKPVNMAALAEALRDIAETHAHQPPPAL